MFSYPFANFNISFHFLHPNDTYNYAAKLYIIETSIRVFYPKMVIQRQFFSNKNFILFYFFNNSIYLGFIVIKVKLLLIQSITLKRLKHHKIHFWDFSITPSTPENQLCNAASLRYHRILSHTDFPLGFDLKLKTGKYQQRLTI